MIVADAGPLIALASIGYRLSGQLVTEIRSNARTYCQR